MEGNLLYSKSTDLNVNLIIRFTETPRMMFDQIPGHHGPAMLTHIISHHKWIKGRGKQGK